MLLSGEGYAKFQYIQLAKLGGAVDLITILTWLRDMILAAEHLRAGSRLIFILLQVLDSQSKQGNRANRVAQTIDRLVECDPKPCWRISEISEVKGGFGNKSLGRRCPTSRS